ncbi:MAG: transferase [Proteobacteria bacterium]|nr:transferase [Pseudomonadota bacterium]
MKQVEKLIDRVINRVNINLREFNFDATPYAKKVIPLKQMINFDGFYGITSHHPIHFNFIHSNLAGSYFLGKCITDHALVYKTDVRGDELKKKGDDFTYQGTSFPIDTDEAIRICDSYLIKTLIHSFSHDPESPEEFLIRNSMSGFYANIHGSPIEGCYLAPFSTVDLTTLHSCIIGTFSYVCAGDLYHAQVPDGTIWLKGDTFEFKYTFEKAILDKYINNNLDARPTGILMDFVESRKYDFQAVFDSATNKPDINVPSQSAVNRYAYVAGDTTIGENVLISQRAYLVNAWMGPGTNAQENSYIINSRLEKNDITAHGAKIINAWLGEKVFVGFNCFLQGKPGLPLSIGQGCIIMPHTIIDLEEPLEIQAESVVWGYIQNKADLEQNSIPLSELKKINKDIEHKNIMFKGSGKDLVEGFQQRIDNILEANGAYFTNENKKTGHAQKGHSISYNIIQPYLTGKNKGIFPSISIRP